ncbi:MAG TPA: amino acid ABC transporter substrate-binding protein, partial [Tistrella mobilis]|nr:amino acid ABC transporter substrate-binding protein [Tistrella mobilis]
MRLKTLAAAITALAIGAVAPAFAAETVKVGVTTTGVPFTFV